MYPSAPVTYSGLHQYMPVKEGLTAFLTAPLSLMADFLDP